MSFDSTTLKRLLPVKRSSLLPAIPFSVQSLLTIAFSGALLGFSPAHASESVRLPTFGDTSEATVSAGAPVSAPESATATAVKKQWKRVRRKVASLRMTISQPSLISNAEASMIPETNETYFRSTAVRTDPGWSSEWLDTKTSNRWKNDLEVTQLRQERVGQTGILDAQEERNQTESMKGLSKAALNDLTNLYTRSQLQRLQGKAEAIDTSVKGPIVATLFVATTMTGRELRYRPSNWMTIKSRTRLQGRQSSLTFATPVVETLVGYRQPGSDRTMSAQILTRLDQNWTTGFDTSYGGMFRVNYSLGF